MVLKRRAISCILFDYALEFYNTFLYYKFTTTFSTGSDFSREVFPLIRDEYPNLSYGNFRVVGIAFYYFINGHLQDFARRNRLGRLEGSWRDDLDNKFRDSHVSEQVKRLEERCVVQRVA